MSKVVYLLMLFSTGVFAQPKVSELSGAWEGGSDGKKLTMIVVLGYFSVAEYDLVNKKFITTYGGKWKLEGSRMVQLIEYDATTPDNVGNERKLDLKLKKDLKVGSTTFKKLDDGSPGKLAGAWLITGRVTDKGLQTRTPGVRKTMKILSGTRFQWIAYNTETKEFLGTGGGNYTSEDGKYVENLEFFSRDNTRVGASLSFDFSLEAEGWHHKGFSSKGDPIHEVWTRREKLEE